MEEKKGKKRGWPTGKKRDKPSFTGKTKDNREHIIRKIAKHKDAILQAQIESAKGLWFFDDKKNMVYTKKPDTSIGEYLLNQLIGKPKESMELSGEVQLKIDL